MKSVQLLRGTAWPAFVATPRGRILDANEALRALCGEQQVSRVGQLVDPRDADGLLDLMVASAGDGGHRMVDCRMRVDGATPRWFRMSVARVDDALLVTAVDVDELMRADRTSVAAEFERATGPAQLAVAVAVGGLGVWDYDIEHDDLCCDARWHAIMGRSTDEPVTTIDELRTIIHPEDRDRATEVAHTSRELIATGEDYAIEFRIVRPDGQERWVRSAAQVEERGGAPTRATGFVVDVTDERRHQHQLETLNRLLLEERQFLTREAMEDPLTGVANRRAHDRALPRLCREGQRAEQPVSFGLLDVDCFKQFNDRYGHPAGDEALRSLAARLSSVMGEHDLLARYGGEEFAFVSIGSGGPSALLDRIFDAVAELDIPHIDAPTGRLTVSCGCVVSHPEDPYSPTQLIQISDRMLYEAKHAGRNCYRVLGLPGD